MKELRVFLVDADNASENSKFQHSDNDFMNEAELQGNSYSLTGFVHAWNNDQINFNTFMKIIEV